ncbi:MAG: hypothetical protein LBI29_01170 [Rickettsiales bacterium]|jgi:hypothetical protein|nr:hypothetical protein [Rickettsiales bacterium]
MVRKGGGLVFAVFLEFFTGAVFCNKYSHGSPPDRGRRFYVWGGISSAVATVFYEVYRTGILRSVWGCSKSQLSLYGRTRELEKSRKAREKSEINARYEEEKAKRDEKAKLEMLLSNANLTAYVAKEYFGEDLGSTLKNNEDGLSERFGDIECGISAENKNIISSFILDRIVKEVAEEDQNGPMDAEARAKLGRGVSLMAEGIGTICTKNPEKSRESIKRYIDDSKEHICKAGYMTFCSRN